jgi:DNA-binding CsgD family transcriptional regulator
MRLIYIYTTLLALSFANLANAQAALTFDGSNNYKDFGKSSAFAISGDLTVEVKLKSTTVLDYCPLVSNSIEDETGNYHGYWLGIDTSGYALLSIGGETAGELSYDVIGTSLIDDEKWHHISGVVNVSSATPTAMIYVDGVLENTISIPNPNTLSKGTFYIGTDVWAYFHQGELDDVRLWDRILSSTEIDQNLDSSLTGNENGLVAHYQFGIGTGKYKEFLHYTWEDRKVRRRMLTAAQQEKLKAEKRLIIVGLVALFIIILLLFLRYRSIQSKNSILKQVQLETVKKEQEILKLRVKEENRNVRELSLELITKKEFSETILKKLRQFKQVSKSDLMNLEMFIQNELGIKSTRAELQNQMGELSLNFYTELKIHHPNLSEIEVKLAAMIVMKMSNKEIAINKNITPPSVRIAKVRLKKKLEIPKETDLSEYLSALL